MNESATASRLERRMLRTAEQLTEVSRRLTAEHGLNGFTVEELCDEVGISRRTFFNYFPTKEDAVMGVDQAEEARRFADEFLARGSRGWTVIVDDLVELLVIHFADAGIDVASHAQFMAALEREPRLLTRFMGATRDRERQLATLIAERESVDAGDPRAEAAVQILSTLLRVTGEKFFNPANSIEFASILSESLAAVRTVMGSSQL